MSSDMATDPRGSDAALQHLYEGFPGVASPKPTTTAALVIDQCHPQSQSPFFRLPAEIRHEIYERAGLRNGRVHFDVTCGLPPPAESTKRHRSIQSDTSILRDVHHRQHRLEWRVRSGLCLHGDCTSAMFDECLVPVSTLHSMTADPSSTHEQACPLPMLPWLLACRLSHLDVSGPFQSSTTLLLTSKPYHAHLPCFLPSTFLSALTSLEIHCFKPWKDELLAPLFCHSPSDLLLPTDTTIITTTTHYFPHQRHHHRHNGLTSARNHPTLIQQVLSSTSSSSWCPALRHVTLVMRHTSEYHLRAAEGLASPGGEQWWERVGLEAEAKGAWWALEAGVAGLLRGDGGGGGGGGGGSVEPEEDEEDEDEEDGAAEGHVGPTVEIVVGQALWAFFVRGARQQGCEVEGWEKGRDGKEGRGLRVDGAGDVWVVLG